MRRAEAMSQAFKLVSKHSGKKNPANVPASAEQQLSSYREPDRRGHSHHLLAARNRNVVCK